MIGCSARPGPCEFKVHSPLRVSVVEATEKRFSVASRARIFSLSGAERTRTSFNRFDRPSRPSAFLVRRRSDPVRVGGAQGAAAILGCGARSAPYTRPGARARVIIFAPAGRDPCPAAQDPDRRDAGKGRLGPAAAATRKGNPVALPLFVWPAPSRLLRRPSPRLREAGGPGIGQGKAKKRKKNDRGELRPRPAPPEGKRGRPAGGPPAARSEPGKQA